MLSCSVVVLRHTRISQNGASLVAIIYLSSFSSAIGTKAELLTRKACVGAIGEPSSPLHGGLMGIDMAAALSMGPWFVWLLLGLLSGGTT